MRSNLINFAIFLVLAVGLWFLWSYAEKHWLPKPPKNEIAELKKKEAEETEARLIKEAHEAERRQQEEKEAEEKLANRRIAQSAVTGFIGTLFEPVAKPTATTAEPKKTTEPKKTPGPTESSKPKPLPILIEMGSPAYNLHVLLNTRGGGVQQVILTKFDAADRLGREVKEKDANGKPTEKGFPLYLIPGEALYRGPFLREDYLPPALKPGQVADPLTLAETSYTLFHYAAPDDKYPDPYLGETDWKVAKEEHPDGGMHTVVLVAELGEPYHVKFSKTFTLAPGDYHIGFELKIERLSAGKKKSGLLRYQLSGPRGLPIEGEWYTTTYRNAIIGWNDRTGTPQRQIEDASSIATMHGGDPVMKGDNTFKYMVVETQYFASGIAIDDTADDAVKNPWARVRATSETPLGVKPNPNSRLFEDVTVRAASDVLDLEPGAFVTHKYIIYNGPGKVRLLGLMEGSRTVPQELVDRYRDQFGLKTIKDFHSPNWFGSIANFLWWSDLVIFVTNLLHSFLSLIHHVLPDWGVTIIVVTVLVRLILLSASRRQTRMNLKMMEIQKRLAPQIEELKKRYGDDFSTFNREKMRLMMANGINPAAQMGGCLLLMLQMPVMVALYCCLQESIFFRLDHFLWIDNLAAPDMTLWWSEKIPFVSTPENIGSMFYLGPYLNILPIIAVGLMLWQQKKMMPEATTPEMQQQQTMMKYMMIFMAVMFYKVASGLALYLIVGSLWGIVERRYFVTHPGKELDAAAGRQPPDGGSGPGGGGPAGPPPKGGSPNGDVDANKPKGLFGRMREAVQERMDEMKQRADEQSQRQIRNNPDERRRDRKKKRRK